MQEMFDKRSRLAIMFRLANFLIRKESPLAAGNERL